MQILRDVLAHSKIKKETHRNMHHLFKWIVCVCVHCTGIIWRASQLALNVTMGKIDLNIALLIVFAFFLSIFTFAFKSAGEFSWFQHLILFVRRWSVRLKLSSIFFMELFIYLRVCVRLLCISDDNNIIVSSHALTNEYMNCYLFCLKIKKTAKAWIGHDHTAAAAADDWM